MMLTEAQQNAARAMADAYPELPINTTAVWEDSTGYVAMLEEDILDTWISLDKRSGEIANVNPLDHLARPLVLRGERFQGGRSVS
jgi:hypothetical protein